MAAQYLSPQQSFYFAIDGIRRHQYNVPERYESHVLFIGELLPDKGEDYLKNNLLSGKYKDLESLALLSLR